LTIIAQAVTPVGEKMQKALVAKSNTQNMWNFEDNTKMNLKETKSQGVNIFI